MTTMSTVTIADNVTCYPGAQSPENTQARAEELSEHEEQLEAWKQKFKAEALRQIGEREKTLADWQAKLDRKKTDLEELQRSVEVTPASDCDVCKHGGLITSVTPLAS